MTTINEIETATKSYAENRAKMVELVQSLTDGIEALKRQHVPAIKRAIGRVLEKHDELKALINASPELFVKPRTVVFHGIKIGYLKGKGGIEIEHPEQTLKLIRKHFPDQADVLIATKEAPAKDTLAQLTVAELKRLGCTVKDTGDVVFIKPADSEIDRLVETLIKGAAEMEQV